MWSADFFQLNLEIINKHKQDEEEVPLLKHDSYNIRTIILYLVKAIEKIKPV